ncbi:MAG TPA: hypothetical protein ENJ95_13510 [Bacteroidetes bacterium]|nr:hypothetical protein [Bacteroidota bacterium]
MYSLASRTNTKEYILDTALSKGVLRTNSHSLILSFSHSLILSFSHSLKLSFSQTLVSLILSIPFLEL